MKIYKVKFPIPRSAKPKNMYFVQVFCIDDVKILRIMDSVVLSSSLRNFDFNEITRLFGVKGSIFAPKNKCGFRLKDLARGIDFSTNSIFEFNSIIKDNFLSLVSDNFIEMIDLFVNGKFPDNMPQGVEVEEVLC